MASPSEEIIDQFAGQAMAAMLSNADMLRALLKSGPKAKTYEEALETIARRAYDIATVMMAERGKRRRTEAEFQFKGREPLI